MLLIPFIYFLLLTIYFYKIHGHLNLDVAASSILMAISFFAILIDVNDVYGKYGINENENNLFTILLFCLQWTLVLWPLKILSSLPLKGVDQLKKPVFYGLCIVVIVASVLMIVSSLSDIRDALVMDMVDNYNTNALLRGMGGRESSNPLLLIPTIFTSNPFPTLALFLWFYSVAFNEGNVLIRMGLLLASIVQAALSIIVAGRAALVYWMIEFVLFYCFFSHYFSARVRRVIMLASAALGSLIVSVFITITISRFGDNSDDKTSDPLVSLYSYAGQHITNFSAMVMKGAEAPFQIGRVFPLTNRIVNGTQFDLIEHYDRIHSAVTIQANVFSTFGGELFLDLGVFGYVIFLLLLSLLTIMIRNEWTELPFYRIFILVIVVAFFSHGLFAWPFISQYCTYSLILFALFYLLFKYEYKV